VPATSSARRSVPCCSTSRPLRNRVGLGLNTIGHEVGLESCLPTLKCSMRRDRVGGEDISICSQSSCSATGTRRPQDLREGWLSIELRYATRQRSIEPRRRRRFAVWEDRADCDEAETRGPRGPGGRPWLHEGERQRRSAPVSELRHEDPGEGACLLGRDPDAGGLLPRFTLGWVAGAKKKVARPFG
jgi:hypothetical protein